MTYTLADYSRLATDHLLKGVIDTFRKESKISDTLRFETTGSLNLKFNRTKTLPDVQWRKIGEAFTESKGVTEPLEEKLALLGGYFDMSKELVRSKDQIENQRALQTSMMTKAMAYAFHDKFINGRPDSDEDELVGLWYRLKHDLAAAQSVLAASGGLDVSADATGLAANQITLIDQIEALLDACDNHTCDMLLMNNTMRLRLNSALKASGMLASVKDNYARTFTTYGDGGPIILDMGYKADQTTRVITNSETVAGLLTGGAQTSIYAVKFGEGYVKGWQQSPLEVVDKGLLENHVAFRTVVDWGMGIYFYNPRSFARLYGIIAA